MIQIGLLGGLRVEAEGRVFDSFPRRKVAALFALLTLRPRQKHSREELAVQLWPDANTETGRRNLRQTLLYLRQSFEPLELICSDSQTLWLCEGITTDVAAFEAAIQMGDLARARSLWRGELLPGFFEEAILTERERLKALFTALPHEGIPPPTIPSSLPIYLSEFHGREDEIERLSTLLAEPGTRLVTLLGPGGIGKTRLASTVVSGGKREAAFVELAALAPGCDEALVFQKIGEALAFSVGGQESSEESLLRLLASRPLLLILDNAEHVLAQTASVALRLLRAAPRLKLIVTSREPLRLMGERTLVLEPLAIETAMRFLQVSARAIRPELPEDPEALTQICAKLEGLPIALELAASQCRTLSLQEIAQDLSQGLGLSEQASTSLPLRHRSLEATLAWSEALLTPPQQQLLRRLSVFSGGGTREAILEICEASRGDLAALVEKSLLQVRILPDGTTRYRSLEPIRQWAEERLAQSDEAVLVRQRHGRWFLDLAERAAPELRRREQHLWFKRLDAEQANFFTAYTTLHSRHKLRLVSALGSYWIRREFLHEGVRLTEQALAEVADTSEAHSATLLTLGVLLLRAGQRERALELLKAASHSDDRRVAIEATLYLKAEVTPNSYESYQSSIEPILEEIQNDTRWRWHYGQALLQGERFLNHNRDHEKKIAILAQAIALFEEEGDRAKVMEALFALVGIHLVYQRFEIAAPILEQLQETAALLESTHMEVLALNMQIRAQRAQLVPDVAILKELADRLALLAPRLGAPGDAYNAWHDLMQACRHLSRWQLAHKAMLQMLHFRKGTITRPMMGVYFLGAVASLMADIGQAERCGKLYGYIFTVRESVQLPPNALEQRVYDRDLACLQQESPEVLEKALAQGRSLTFEQVFALAQEPIVLPPEGAVPLLPPI
ncbi:NB-ARC domain-containing protein [Armatimonas sp.]|uniref:AfsR/SARP family transcriptional regulator n=1 Tax=Armatimonas sp. TaxID=1872638 RepID=UPI00286CF1A0|nr:NB-ARC domain-containing protein [Armatimonas sp.]